MRQASRPCNERWSVMSLISAESLPETNVMMHLMKNSLLAVRAVRPTLRLL